MVPSFVLNAQYFTDAATSRAALFRLARTSQVLMDIVAVCFFCEGGRRAAEAPRKSRAERSQAVVAHGLTVVAGTTLIQPRLSGDPVARGLVGPVPVGPRPRYALMNVTYGPPRWNGFSVDAQLLSSSAKMAHSDNRLKAPGWTELNVGARYSLRVCGAPATLRVQAMNLTDTYAWNVSSSGSFFPRPSRRFVTSTTADF